MNINPKLTKLQSYPFERLNKLLAEDQPNTLLRPLNLSIGEPKHRPPEFVIEELMSESAMNSSLSQYPATKGSQSLREAISSWFISRFETRLNPDTQVLPVNGTREGLFSIAQSVLSGRANSSVGMPNPFYQIYEGAALLAGSTPFFFNHETTNGNKPNFKDVDHLAWQQCDLLYVCSPANPSGYILSDEESKWLLEKSMEHDFVIISDECYSEIYINETKKPKSLLQICRDLGNSSFKNCVVFHSLSKRSNLPGLRSGFVAGDAEVIKNFLKYRTYHGSAMPPHHQRASEKAWGDEAHVVQNRQLYREKFDAVRQVLETSFVLDEPDGGFYHWINLNYSDELFCQKLYQQQAVKVMPGSFLSRPVKRNDSMVNPGAKHIRVAWVAELAECIEAAKRMVALKESL